MSDVFQKTLILLIKDFTWSWFFSGEIEYDNAEVQKIPKSKATLLAIFFAVFEEKFFLGFTGLFYDHWPPRSKSTKLISRSGFITRN